MPNRKLLLLALAAAASFACAPAMAQDEPVVTLRVDIGTAMASSGGEFATAASGSQLSPGDRVMLTEGSQATLVYDNNCTHTLANAGVHVVPGSCDRAAVVGAGGVDVGGAAIVTGVAVTGAAILANMDDVDYVPPPPPPVSR